MVSDPVTSSAQFDIATVTTFDYIPFLLAFLGSFDRNVRNDEIGKIHIMSDPLPTPIEQGLRDRERVNLTVNGGNSARFDGVHGESWRNAVAQKLNFVRDLLQKQKRPILLLDSDMIFIRDIPSGLFKSGDLVFTYIDNPAQRHIRRDGIPINFIASAVFFGDVQRSLDTIDEWLEIMSSLTKTHNPPYETPALNLMLQKMAADQSRVKGEVKTMNESFIASDQSVGAHSVLIHLKSWGPSKKNAIQNYWERAAIRPWEATQFGPAFMDFHLYEEWLVYQLKYKKFHD